MYYVECECGRHIAVELFQAGTAVTCPGCASVNDVPSSSKLKEQSGDNYPHLSPIEKVLATFSAQEPPFHGICHSCAEEPAVFQIPILFDVMVERTELGESGVKLGLQGFELVVADTEEQRKCARFSLLLCRDCRDGFVRKQERAGIVKLMKNVSMFGLLFVFLFMAWHNLEAVAALGGLIALIGSVAWLLTFRNTRHREQFVMPWLRGIRWVGEAIAAESEYQLTVGKVEPYLPMPRPERNDPA